MGNVGLATIIIASLSIAAGSSLADDVEDFYRGKTIEFVVGAAAGGGLDLVARPLAPYLSKYLPGNPTIIVRNMPGAAGVVMANYLVSAARKDGTVIGMAVSNIPYEPRLNTLAADVIKYDPSKLGWIGTPVREPQVSWVWHTAGINTWEDMKTKRVRFGATSAAGDNAIFPALANQLLGLKSEVIIGYKGVSEIFLAVERGELEGNSTAYSFLHISKPDWVRDKKANIVLQFGLQRLEELNTVPTLLELVSDPEDKQMLRYLLLKFEMHRPIFTAPGVPGPRLAALRRAFDKAVADPEFLAATKKIGIDISPLGGEAVEKLVEEVVNTPQPVVDRLKATLAAAGLK
jgi:tripartite-type tricarboxylate transporter receptor subunit TctC